MTVVEGVVRMNNNVDPDQPNFVGFVESGLDHTGKNNAQW